MLGLPKETRDRLWRALVDAVEAYAVRVESHRVAPPLDPEAIRARLDAFDFAKPLDPLDALDFAVRGLWDYQTHTPHPRYYGLFNPAPTTMGIAADTLVAAFNPQLAAWSHSPLAAEIEQHLIRAFGERFGYDGGATEGTFASGGAEANHTALLTSLIHNFPEFARRGVRALAQQPTLYISAEGHHSILKAARLTGVGTDAVREIPLNDDWQMDVRALNVQIRRDREEGFAPFLVVATAGTTSGGVVDPVAEIAGVARSEGLWFHLDAAWGGAAAFVPDLRHVLAGSEHADSITFDAHKWLSVPMGAGVYLTRHQGILERTFRIATGYMPREAATMDVRDPFAHSMQWSRRFIGLKVFLSLAVAGWEGYAETIHRQTRMGDLLREQLAQAGWIIVNKTKLPTICFVDGAVEQGRAAEYLDAIAREVVTSGEAWISTSRIGGTLPVLRACITNYRTGPEDIRALVQTLNDARVRLTTR